MAIFSGNEVVSTVLVSTKKMLGVNLVLTALSGRLKVLKFAERVARWAVAALAVSAATKSAGSAGVLPPPVAVFRALACHMCLSVNTQTLLLCDAVSHAAYGRLKCVLPAPNVTLTCVALAEVLTKWSVASPALLYGYREFLDWASGCDAATLRVVHGEMHAAKPSMEVLRSKVFPRGVAASVLWNMATRTFPYYMAIQAAQMLVTGSPINAFRVTCTACMLSCMVVCGWLQYYVSVPLNRAWPHPAWFYLGAALSGLTVAIEPSLAMRRAVRHTCLTMAVYSRSRNLPVPAAITAVVDQLLTGNAAMVRWLQ